MMQIGQFFFVFVRLLEGAWPPPIGAAYVRSYGRKSILKIEHAKLHNAITLIEAYTPTGIAELSVYLTAVLPSRAYLSVIPTGPTILASFRFINSVHFNFKLYLHISKLT